MDICTPSRMMECPARLELQDQLEKCLRNDPLVDRVLGDPETYRPQILVQPLVVSSHRAAAQDGRGRDQPRAYRVGCDARRYFYPASAIKLCAAIAALKKVADLQESGLDISLTSRLTFHCCGSTHSSRTRPECTTIAHEIRKMCLVSDNCAFNRLFEFVGHAALNQSMWDAGLESVRIVHHLYSELVFEDNRKSPQIDVHLPDDSVHVLLPQNSALDLSALESSICDFRIGSAYIAPDSVRVDEPMDFEFRNRISIDDLQSMMQMLVFPEEMKRKGMTFGLREDHRHFLLEAMLQYPQTSFNPRYNPKEYPDDHVKFFLPGIKQVWDISSVRIYNKCGLALGHMIDNGYIWNAETGEGYFLTACVYVNANKCLNDDIYEYDIGDKFLASVAKTVTSFLFPE